MKNLFILAICVFSSVFYAQSAGEKGGAENRIDIIAAVDPSYSLTYNPAGMDYFIFDMVGPYIQVVTKIDNLTYRYFKIKMSGSTLYQDEIIEDRYIKNLPIYDKIFNNFVPKPGVKRYISEYPQLSYSNTLTACYFAIYKKGVKTFDTNVIMLSSFDGEVPFDSDIYRYMIQYLIVNPDQL